MCGLPRYFKNDLGVNFPVNVFRSLAIDSQLRRIFANPKTAVFMRMSRYHAPSSDTKISDITQSLGFSEIVWDSGYMSDNRNVVLLGGTDGGNPFARERVSSYSLWPWIFFVCNLPSNLRYKKKNVVLGGLIAGHVYINGIKKNRSVSNINAYTAFFLDEISRVSKSSPFVDSSYSLDSNRRVFHPTAMLLGVIGDYDALSTVLCMVGATGRCSCLKCKIKGVRFASVNTRVVAQTRRYFPMRHPARNDPRYGGSEMRNEPRARTRQDSIKLGQRAHDLKVAAESKQYGAASAYKRFMYRHGVTDLCPLTRQPGFDMHDRCFLDWMHLMKNIVYLHLLKRMLGLASVPLYQKMLWECRTKKSETQCQILH